MKTETKCLHAGYEPKNGEPREVPIYQSTTFKYDSSLQMGRLFDLEDSGYFYSRLQNPTNDIVASKIAALEGGIAAMLTSSGQAANFFAVFNIENTYCWICDCFSKDTFCVWLEFFLKIFFTDFWVNKCTVNTHFLHCYAK